MEKKWIKIDRNGIGRFGYEIYQNSQEPERFLVKIFIYDKPVLLSGTKEVIGSKIKELKEIFNTLHDLFNDEIPF